MIIQQLVQNTPEWHAYRTQHWNASDAPAMMDCSPYMTRTELLTRVKTGISVEVDEATQRRFDDGHRFEALARPLAEEIIGEDLYPVVGSKGKLSASFDGLTIGNAVNFEHKSLNNALRTAMFEGCTGADLPLAYQIQMEHQHLVSGAAKTLFMASKWNGNELVEEHHCWYVSDPDLRAKIIAGWDQFEKDLADFVPATPEVKPIGRAPESLPALHIVIQGGVSASNLDEFKTTALNAIRSVSRELTTDAHFADAEKAVKWCEDVESRIKAAKDHALSQTASIDELFRTMDEISSEAREVRLDLAKLVKARKESIKGEIVASGVAALAAHIRELNAAMPADYMPQVTADFGGCIKGLKSVDSIRNAVDSELARVKIVANEIATRIQANVQYAADNIEKSQLPDLAILVLKAHDDFAAIVQQRLAAQSQREAEARERIRAEEVARLGLEAEAKAAADKSKGNAHTPDERHVIAAAAVQPNQDDSARIKLGEINLRIAPLSITADGLAQLGFVHISTDKSAKLYRESDFAAICKAMADHLNSVTDFELAAS